jgi:hypothetical protein
MTHPHDAISALLDNEPFDPQELLEALSDPSGRKLLVDLAALRRIVQPADNVPAFAAAVAPQPRPWRLFAAAAAVLLALAGGYAAGTRQTAEPSAEAPAPTRVVQAVPFTPGGGVR